MIIARKFLVRNGQVGTYHVMSRCVRRAFLCGQDPYTAQNYEHRKEWIKKRLKFLASLFSLEVCGYAVMSNHVHLMLRMRPDHAEKWDREEIALRWWKLFPKQRNKDGSPAEPKDYELDQVLLDPKTGQPDGRLNLLRKRLSSMSWFMRCFSENIARRANREDECTRRFWQGRFKCTELLDQAAVLSCLAYIDLNPIHAG
ncbi:MAG: hypothetical protein CR997_00855 [Acidobacteria bacterium]|nr:MAG: hypothetical protein CR997_00855 [Acidobacteriota bacterium]